MGKSSGRSAYINHFIHCNSNAKGANEMSDNKTKSEQLAEAIAAMEKTAALVEVCDANAVAQEA